MWIAIVLPFVFTLTGISKVHIGKCTKTLPNGSCFQIQGPFTPRGGLPLYFHLYSHWLAPLKYILVSEKKHYPIDHVYKSKALSLLGMDGHFYSHWLAPLKLMLVSVKRYYSMDQVYKSKAPSFLGLDSHCTSIRIHIDWHL